MVVGKGLIAQAFKPYFELNEDVVIFASGVSNSAETRFSEFDRERNLLNQYLSLSKKTLVYFSTCSLNDISLVKTQYVVFKSEMESLIVNNFENYLIIRLPQVVGASDNTCTLTNFIYSHILFAKEFKLWKKAKRNLIDVDDVASIVNYLVSSGLFNNSTINVASPFSVSMFDLVKIFEDLLQITAKFTVVNAGNEYEIDSKTSLGIASKIGISFDDNYIKKLISKYYGNEKKN